VRGSPATSVSVAPGSRARMHPRGPEPSPNDEEHPEPEHDDVDHGVRDRQWDRPCDGHAIAVAVRARDGTESRHWCRLASARAGSAGTQSSCSRRIRAGTSHGRGSPRASTRPPIRRRRRPTVDRAPRCLRSGFDPRHELREVLVITGTRGGAER